MNPGFGQFDVSLEASVVTSTYVTNEGMPILYVTHEYDLDEDESVWQFHCGNGDFSGDVLMLVRLDEILQIDPSVAEVATHPIGFGARRQVVGGPWSIAPEPDQR